MPSPTDRPIQEDRTDRPIQEDRAALRILLDREDLSDFDAEFIDDLRNWIGNWTPKQAAYFDVIWSKYY